MILMRLGAHWHLRIGWLSAMGLAAAAPLQSALGQPVELPSTPACAQPAQPTPAQTEGPYYIRNPPRRHVLLGDPLLLGDRRASNRIVLTGFVLTRSCRPVRGVIVDVWQADARGSYDNVGFNLRGHEFTDEQGRYWFETVVPGEYPGRTRHIHVKIQAPGRHPLTTQLYFPNEGSNANDSIFKQALLLSISQASNARSEEPARVGRFDFVLDMP
jgi:protocatechuate 3,4-dioxygenase beta subunit